MEYYENEPVSLFLKDLKKIKAYNSPKQHVELFEHPWLGKILIINGEIQHIEQYQTLYHESLVHLPAAFIPIVRTVLIIGGGSLFAASEALKYPSVENVTLCDHDHSVLELMAMHYPHARAVLQDKRFHYIENDARDFICKAQSPYDLVINDCFNLAAESNRANISYFNLLSKLCADNGACVDIIYRHIFDKQVTTDTLAYLKKESSLALSLVTVPEYPGILHIETIWGKSPYIAQNCKKPANLYQCEILVGNIASPFYFFSPDSLPFYLYLPPYIKDKFNL